MSKFHQGEGEFIFPNEDKYEGQFCAHVSGLAWREGHGVYTTHDDQTYEGSWKDDKLNEAENVKITFQNRNNYTGRISKYKYQGAGTYTFEDASRLTGSFANNKPSGNVLYIDDRDEIWYGKAGAENAILSKEHIFSSELTDDMGKGRQLYKTATAEVPTLEDRQNESQEDVADMKELEKLTFAKSFKTAADIDFEESEWITNHKKSEQIRKTVIAKLSKSDDAKLTKEEREWHKRNWMSNVILGDHREKQLQDIDDDTLRQYLEELENQCPLEKVLYPTEPEAEQAPEKEVFEEEVPEEEVHEEETVEGK